MDHPTVSVGTAAEYAYWVKRLRKVLRSRGVLPDELEQVDARYNFEANRIVLYRLAHRTSELSVSETISHEVLHALLEQLGERRAARALDLVSRPVGDPVRVGGV